MYGQEEASGEVDIKKQRELEYRLVDVQDPRTGEWSRKREMVPVESPIVDLVKKIISPDIDPDPPDAEAKKKNERILDQAKSAYGYDEAITKSADAILGNPAKGIPTPTGAVTPEILIRFQKIVEHAQLTVNFFISQDIVDTINALRVPPTPTGTEGSLTIEQLYREFRLGEGYADYLKGLASIVQKIQNETKNPGKKFTLDEIKNYVRDFQSLSYTQTNPDGSKEPTKQDDNLGKLTELGMQAREFLVREGFRHMERPECFEDILGILMLSDKGEYRVGGKKEVMDKDGNVKIHNFIKWVQEKLFYFSDFQDDDQMQGYNMVAFYTTYRQISLMELIVTQPEQYFRKRVKTGITQVEIGSRGEERVKPVYDFADDPIYSRLRDYLVVLVTNSGIDHNNSIKFDQNKHLRGDDWLKLMGELYGQEQFTFGNRLLRYLGLLSTKEEEVNEYLKDPNKRSQHVLGGTLGQAMSRAILINWHLQELGHRKLFDPDNNFMKALGHADMVTEKDGSKHLGGQRAFFQSLILNSLLKNKYLRDAEYLLDSKTANVNGAVKAYKDLLEKCQVEGSSRADVNIFETLKKNKDALLGLGETMGINKSVFKKVEAALNGSGGLEGEVKLALAIVQAFKGYKKEQLNFYESPAKVRTKEGERELVQTAIRDAIAAEHDLPDEDAVYGAHFVDLMGGWFGIQARNDVSLNSLNWWTTVQNFFDYRKKNEEKINFGDPETLNGIKQFMLPLEGLPIKMESYVYKNPVTGEEKVVDDSTDPRYAGHVTKKEHFISLLEYLQGGKGKDVNIGKYQASRAGGTMADNAMKKYHQELLSGMVEMHKAYYQGHGLDLANVVVKKAGAYVIDPKKEDEFQKFRSSARNAFAKAFQTWGLKPDGKGGWKNTEEQTVTIERERIIADSDFKWGKPGEEKQGKKGDYLKVLDDETGEWVDAYEFRAVPMHKAVFHENIRQMEVNHSRSAQELEYGEQAVRQLVGWATQVSFNIHRYRLWEGQTKNPLIETWTQDQVEAVKAFFLHSPGEVREEVMTTGLFRKRKTKIYRMSEGFFTKKDLQDISIRAGVSNWKFLMYDNAPSGLILLLMTFFAIVGHTFKSNATLK